MAISLIGFRMQIVHCGCTQTVFNTLTMLSTIVHIAYKADCSLWVHSACVQHLTMLSTIVHIAYKADCSLWVHSASVQHLTMLSTIVHIAYKADCSLWVHSASVQHPNNAEYYCPYCL